MGVTAIIDYGSGNLRSAAKAFERAAADIGAVTGIRVTDDPAVVAGADRVVLPGVGAFADCRAGLDAVEGMRQALFRRVAEDGVPFLGICVGMQLMADAGHEHVVTKGFGWISGGVERIEPTPEANGRVRKVPHMGWNTLVLNTPSHPVLAGIADGDHAYFVHSYALRPAQPEHQLAEVEYGGSIAAIVGRDNLVGTQFHPEKSQATGLRLIANFLSWKP